jgi:purine catabolism regulator
MITIGDVVADRSLNLALVAGGGGLDNEVTSALVSELTSPGDWLSGGELLMTVGLLLPMEIANCRAYLSECAAAGVAGIALGLGHGLPYQECPDALRAAAEELDVPLMTVPDETPFIAVTKWVFATIAAQERKDLQTAMEVNRRLTAVATSAAPLPALLSAWSESTDTPTPNWWNVHARCRSTHLAVAGRWSGTSRCTRSGRRCRWPTSCSVPTWT